MHELDRSFPLTRPWKTTDLTAIHTSQEHRDRSAVAEQSSDWGLKTTSKCVSRINLRYRMIARERIPSAQQIDRTLLRRLSPVSETAGLHARRCCGSQVDGGRRSLTATMGRLILARCIPSSMKSYTMPHHIDRQQSSSAVPIGLWLRSRGICCAIQRGTLSTLTQRTTRKAERIFVKREGPRDQLIRSRL